MIIYRAGLPKGKISFVENEQRILNEELGKVYKLGGRRIIINANSNGISELDVFDEEKNVVASISGITAVLLHSLLKANLTTPGWHDISITSIWSLIAKIDNKRNNV